MDRIKHMQPHSALKLQCAVNKAHNWFLDQVFPVLVSRYFEPGFSGLAI